MITNLSIEQLFGENAVQDANSLIIQKASLLYLTPASNNSAESLLVSILLKALELFEGQIINESGYSITSEFGVPITYGNDDNTELLNASLFNIYLSERMSNQYITHNLVIHKYENAD